MDPVTAVRSQVTPAGSPMAPDHDRLIRTSSAPTTPPVAETLRQDAVQQLGNAAATMASRLAARDESDHPAVEARAAADAARKAYIKAAIAAGMNPLPVP